uniref:Uncharacterized protein n=1 Tax=Heterorhabditis bacteriophora TaxID=37862 RepID=A0A1I7W9Y0_HETBA
MELAANHSATQVANILDEHEKQARLTE